MSFLEKATVAVLMVFILPLRLLYICHFRIDSDEPQHLHVVWAWTKGLLPYRDVFDNHSPVFQALCAPFFAAFGERGDILIPMRMVQLPLFAAAVYLVWVLVRRFYSPRRAAWTALVFTVFPLWFLDSIEFRPDQLWTLIWVALLVSLSGKKITVESSFLSGLLLGAAFAVSMKSTLFILALIQAFIAVQVLGRVTGASRNGWMVIRNVAAGFVGTLILPALVIAYFWHRNALGDLYDCVIRHNMLPGTGHHVSASSLGLWVAGLAVAAVGAAVISRSNRSAEEKAKLGFIFFSLVFYLATLEAFWPVLSAEDYLPVYPVLIAVFVPPALGLAKAYLREPKWCFGLALAGLELAVILFVVSPLEDRTRDKISMVANTLRLTQPDDFVMDSKGETIYRRRPFRYVLESRTFARLQRGLINDDIAVRLIQTRTPLATLHRMPQEARTFIRKNYVAVAFRLRVLGKVLRGNRDDTANACVFEVAVPQRYTLVTEDGPPEGILDGAPFEGPVELSAGKHIFLPSSPTGELVLIWARALEVGYSPFTVLKPDHKTNQD